MGRPTRLSESFIDGYDETLEHVVLMCSNVIGNNNKFYSIEIQFNKKLTRDQYVIFSHYGRIRGDDIKGGVYEKRSPFQTKEAALREFNKIVKSKQKIKKTKKDNQIIETRYEKIDVASSNVGSNNVKNKTSIVLNSIKKDAFENFGKKEAEVLRMLEEENIHEITNKTSIVFKKGTLQTPLGILTKSHLNKAKNILTEIVDCIANPNIISNQYTEEKLKKLNSDYLTLIPRNLGRVISKKDLINNNEKILNELELINQMAASLELSDMESNDSVDIGFTMELVSGKEKERIIKNINETKKHNNNNHLKVSNVYRIVNKKERDSYERKANELLKNKSSNKYSKYDYKEIDLYHGSKNSNILSILMKGVYIPPKNSGIVTGRMFGNGVYGADSSTKSLNYATGFWGGNRNKNKVYFSLLMRFAMGKTYETDTKLTSGVPEGYDSIFAKGGADLVNNEFIVKEKEQVTMNYLIEYK